MAALAQAMYTLPLTETLRRQISGSVVEALQRRTGRRAVVIRLLRARVTTPAAAQGCGFFVVEKQERAEGDAEGKLVIELYLFA